MSEKKLIELLSLIHISSRLSFGAEPYRIRSSDTWEMPASWRFNTEAPVRSSPFNRTWPPWSFKVPTMASTSSD